METRCKVRYNLEEALQYVVTPGSDSEISDLEDDDGEDLDKIQLEREPCQEASVMSDNCEIIKDGIEDASQNLCLVLKERGILTTATIRNNRLAGCTLKSEKEMKKDGRGSFGFQTDQNTGMVVLRWFDNKCVTLVSTYLNVDETVNVKRWNSSSKTHVDVTCPMIVKAYNTSMGGVDLADMLIALYRCKIKTKRWYLVILFNAVDIAKVNGWLLYRRFCSQMKVPSKKQLPPLTFTA
ncbi:piggyBac transposable element-derived protein 2-like [Rhopilema esculentum]|uniref:piggyBac transposable element-derived protein 2-like n=1 Tax=Rhopilema esculentum TaxID=499914 RepID=UPI0031DDEBB2